MRHESLPRIAAGRASVPSIRLLIVDDSLVARTILSRTLAEHGAFEVVATAARADEALRILAEREVDIILLDVQMPGRDGIDALPELLAASTGAHVVMVSAFCDDGASASVRAMTAGAADTLLKPDAGSFGGQFVTALTSRLLRIGRARRESSPKSARSALAPALQAPLSLRAPVEGEVGCLAIGASTGGIHALAAFFAQLPRSLTVPILVTQHLPGSFMPYFAGQLRDMTGREARVAEEGMRVAPGMLIVAPGDAHLVVTEGWGVPRILFDRSPSRSGCMPSVDPMLESVAALYGARGLAVVLSGMGRDGALGALKLAMAGGEVIVQDAESSVVWGMPGATARAGAASLIAPPARLADRVAARIAASGGR
ncbi:chemotaxis-specific protein-glutamate methyltransferase CheB [Sphingomonas sp. ID0503]|uniref:chemotaxis-specific protein-glutamate methyltransferase CheB n=1 Tax=Sphingomonas sp. ID0503 TaxID=3399691 RepID=UPI003AFAECC0